jgi:hypothetical protein
VDGLARLGAKIRVGPKEFFKFNVKGLLLVIVPDFYQRSFLFVPIALNSERLLEVISLPFIVKI